MRNYPGIGSNKPAFDHLICRASERGYSQAICNEAVGAGIMGDVRIDIRPNPFTTFLNVAMPQELSGTELILANSLGNVVYQSPVHDGAMLDLSAATLAKGVYLYEVKTVGSESVLASGKLIRQ
jgi:hypothetical protein